MASHGSVSPEEVAQYYDGYAPRQQRSGVNDRLYGLYRRLRKMGLRSGSRVLELGCGVGTMTGLLARTVRQGTIEAVDLSPVSISMAQRSIQRSNIVFHAADVVTYVPTRQPFDFILLFDILEHIPVERHSELFQRMAGYCALHTRILLHIPSPGHVAYDRMHNPDLLQVIDQPLPLSGLLTDLTHAGLEITRFRTYGIWNKDDYQYFEVRLQRAYTPVPVGQGRGLLFRARIWARRKWIKLMH